MKLLVLSVLVIFLAQYECGIVRRQSEDDTSFGDRWSLAGLFGKQTTTSTTTVRTRPTTSTTTTTTPANISTGATQQSPQAVARLQRCQQACLVTPEYNPVCGSDGVSYTNQGRLRCAVSCGVDVQYVRNGNC